LFDSDSINAFARTISSQPIGLAYHRPEKWAYAGHCFANVIKKVQQDGGRARFGWIFQGGIMPDAPELGYLVATHHAVWNAQDGSISDVTPFHTNSIPFCVPTGEVLFLVDDKAEPVVIGSNMFAPLPLRFFPLSNDKRLIAYIERKKNEEEQRCRDIYQGNLEGIEATFFLHGEQRE